MQLGVYFFGKIYVFGLDRTPSNTFQPVSTLITSSKVKNILLGKLCTFLKCYFLIFWANFMGPHRG